MSRQPPQPDSLDIVSELARSERSALAAIARSEGLAPEDAVDAVQDGLSTFLDRLREQKVQGDPEDWPAMIAHIVRNTARNGRRRHFRSRPHEGVEEHALAADGASAETLLARAEEHVRLRQCVQELCEVQRSVVILRMLEERRGEDVARALGISSGHVAVLLHRAKATLRTCLTTDSE